MDKTNHRLSIVLGNGHVARTRLGQPVSLRGGSVRATPTATGNTVKRANPVGFDLPTPTLLKVVLLLVGLWLLTRLWSLFLLIFSALLLTAALEPLVARLERRGWPRARTVALLAVTLLAGIALILVLIVQPLVTQGWQLIEDLPEYLDRARRLVPLGSTPAAPAQTTTEAPAVEPDAVISQGIEVGADIVRVLTQLLLVVTMAAYLLVDGERVFSWIARFLPPGRQVQLRRTLPAVSRVVSGYLVGQFITSLLFGAYAFAVLTFLGVPQALFLALLAAVADAIPIFGVLIATAPAALLALTVSPVTAGLVVGLYLSYQLVENNVIVPRVYRGALQISSFAVLVGVAIGTELFGVIGALLALPVAAAIPAIEPIWRGPVPPSQPVPPGGSGEPSAPGADRPGPRPGHGARGRGGPQARRRPPRAGVGPNRSAAVRRLRRTTDPR
ncbi:MAG: AI-2E family transporter [Chloroflexota bacterium]|nr:AI-2E family transporter [Chloroflexota bacterium]